MIDFLQILDLLALLIILLGINLFPFFNFFMKIIYILLVAYLLFGKESGILWIDVSFQILFYAIALYIIRLKYTKEFGKNEMEIDKS